MIIWLASYPKSGNTWVRLFLKSYLSDDKKKFSINEKRDDEFKIERFPNIKVFKDMQINYDNFFEISKNWITIQDRINLNNKLNILKTHNAMCTVNKNKFTNKENTLGAIYIVRDPRDVAVSFSYHMGKTLTEIVNNMIDKKYLISESDFTTEKKVSGSTLLSSWSNHYNSWKNYKSIKSIIIKYEDLVRNTADKFYEIVLYLNELYGTKVDEKKILKSIELTNFKNLQNLEKEHGFEEITISKTFFREGKIGSWKQKLDEKLSKKIENEFKNEMIELGYL